MNRHVAFVSGLVAIVVAGVAGWATWAWWFRGPAASTPVFGTLSVLNPGMTWTSVGPNPSGNYEVLPSAFPNAGLRFYLYAPAGTALSIDLDGQTLPNIPNAGGPSASGFFRVIDVNTKLNPALWVLEIQPPASKMSSTTMVFTIADVALNPIYRGTDHISDPVTITLGARKLFSVSVMLSGMGSGMVTSSPPGIVCPPTCAFDFGQSVTVTLTPHPFSGSTFAGWSGQCVSFGSSGNCQLTLNGVAFSAGAAFRPTATGSSSSVPSCPAPNPPPGFSFWNQPFCPASALGAILSCNSQGYFCCTDGTCSSTFPPSCDYGDPNIAPMPSAATPTGCYLKTGP
jgi:hypothetical protein